jgi:adenylate cyclase
MLEMLSAGIELLGEEVSLQFLRVLGAAAARVADASVSAFMVNIAPPAIDADPSGLALARANTEVIGLLDALASAFDTLLRHHIERGFRPLGPPGGVADVDLVHRSVGFADLVESTSWTEHLDFSTLSRSLTAFDSLASELVVARGGRVVKLIGDEVMFVADDASAAADIALALIEAFAAHDLLPPVRAGVATGEVVARGGDYSGAVVNLAARAVKAAEPSRLLVDHSTRLALTDLATFVCAEERALALKGFAQRVQLCEVSRAG